MTLPDNDTCNYIDSLYKQIESGLASVDNDSTLSSVPALWQLIEEHARTLRTCIQTLGYSTIPSLERGVLYPTLCMRYLRSNHSIFIRVHGVLSYEAWVCLNPFSNSGTLSTSNYTVPNMVSCISHGDVRSIFTSIVSTAEAIHTLSQCVFCKNRMVNARTTTPTCGLPDRIVVKDCPSFISNECNARRLWCGKCHYSDSAIRFCGLGKDMIDGCSSRVISKSLKGPARV